MRKIAILFASLLVGVCAQAVNVPSAGAVDAPGWAVYGRSVPTNLPPGGQGQLRVYVTNVGAAPGENGAVLTDTLPKGVTLSGKPTMEAGHVTTEPACSETVRSEATVLTCTLDANNELTRTTQIHFPVSVAENASGTSLNSMSVSGGGALKTVGSSYPVTISASEPPAGFANLSTVLSNADGTLDTQAGSHPYVVLSTFALNNIGEGVFGSEHPAGGQARNINVNLPPGIFGNPEAIPQCTRKEFDEGVASEKLEPDCPLSSQVGWNYSTVSDLDFFHRGAPVYNMVPPNDAAAQFAFSLLGVPVFLDVGVRTGTDNGTTVATHNFPQRHVTFDVAEIWGNPADPSHNKFRVGIAANGEECAAIWGEELQCPSGVANNPLMTLGTSCGAPPEFTGEEDGLWGNESYKSETVKGYLSNQEGLPTGFTGCEKLQPFLPTVSIAPDTSYADTPAGLSVNVEMPQGLNPEGLQTPDLDDTKVTLPQGVVINPGQATGLQACQPSQEALGTLPDGESDEAAPTCPSASKVGTLEIATPLIPKVLVGNAYILDSDPPNMQLLLTASGGGVNIKLIANVHLDEGTGQLVTTVNATPDVPFTDFKINFSGGAQAALATPTKCGIYGSQAEFTPWSTPFIENVFDSTKFEISSGPNGTPCQWPMPFAPTMTAGATTDQAGGYTSFTMLLQRGDGQQRIERLQFETPEGLLGMIAKIPLCPEPGASKGECSEASQIGSTVVTTGPGPYPFEIPEPGAPPAPIYLTGPYEGAPFGLSIKVPIVAGPFNLGAEVVRSKLEVNPVTSRLTITTNAFPETVKGIPTDIRAIDVDINRSEFMFNPTNCEPMSFSGTAYSNEGASAPLESHFQMGSCRALKFQPNFTVTTQAKTSREDGASLTAKLVYPVGNLGANQASSQSNINTIKVELPKQLPSRLTTLQKACTRGTFDANPANCPPASRVGTAKALTPVVPVPLEGPAYFVSNGNAKFPELIIVLQGYGVRIDLNGETFISEKGITSSTFTKVPDVPIGLFEFTLPEGPDSALAANGNLCNAKLTMPTHFVAQNGAVLNQNTKVSVVGCKKAIRVVKHKAKKHKKKHHKAKKNRKDKGKKG